jgi:hypothetical protein
MKKYFLFMVVFLAACAPVQSVPTDDPFVGLAIAEAEAARYQAQLTGTAVAWQMQGQAWTVTSQSWTPTASLTSVPTATPSITPTPTVDVTQTLKVEYMNAEIEDIRRESERKEATNDLLAFLPYVVIILSVALASFIGFVGAKRLSYKTLAKDDKGDAPLVLNVVGNRITDSDKNPNSESGVPDMKDILWNAFQQWLEKNHGIQPVQPRITAERQDEVTRRDQTTDMKSRTKVTNAAFERFMKEHELSKPQSPTPVVASLPMQTSITDDDYNLPLPQWDLMRKWDGSSKPLGFGRNGLILSKAASPHILISGMTGTGKTLFMMRTLATASLAQGAQVINIGYSDSGFGVFNAHKNYHAVQIPKAEAIVEVLTQVYQELGERKRMIGGEAVEWEHWHQGEEPPRPFLDLFMDELGNLAEDIYYQNAALNKVMWSLVARIANEGRKVGIRFVAALQDPTSKSMDLRFRRNCTLVSFRQGDRTQSDTFIGAQGAENLPVGRFMARTDALMMGGGFNPSDIQILAYLAERAVPVRPAPRWIEAINQPRIEVDEDPPLIMPTREEPVKPVDEIAEMAERIRSQWSAGMSKSEVSRLFGKEFAGTSWTAKVNKVIAYLTSTTPTSTEKQPEIGSFAPEMA